MRIRATLRPVVVVLALIAPGVVAAQQQQKVHGLVVDQTGLPLPGVRIDLERSGEIVHTLTTEPDGTFDLTNALEGDIVVTTLDGFETTRAPIAKVNPIVMPLARTSEVTQVTASALTSSGAAMERLGSTMTAPLAQRLPTPRPRILQSLPLLPGVVRGPDGQLRIGGTRPHEGSLWIDGFDVTDPVTRTSTIDLPNESVKGMAVLRDPISATFSGVLGSLASIETTPGGDMFRAGIQGFIPRPRLTNYGLGKIEGFFPRAYIGGGTGRVHYFASTELNYERVPVPGVTSRSGRPDIGATGVTSFVRLDYDISKQQRITFDGLYAPFEQEFSGLSPLRGPEASPNVHTEDIVAGVVDRIVVSSSDLLTIRAGLVSHGTALAANGEGPALLRPTGWSQNWFATVDHWGNQRALSVTWDHSGVQALGQHTISLVGNIRRRAMDAAIDEMPIHVLDDDDRLRRLVQFGRPVQLRAVDYTGGVGLRDLWDVSPRMQVDLGIRFDRSVESVLSPRIGVRYNLDENGRVVLKASAGRFVGFAPLGAFGYDQFPIRRESTYDPLSGALKHATIFDPTLTPITLPRSDGVAVDFEFRVTPRLEISTGVRARNGQQLPTVVVPDSSGSLLLASTGTSEYREFEITAHHTWRKQNQTLISYVRSSSRGDINDFGSLYTSLTTPLIQPGAFAPTTADVPHRLRAWTTVNLPNRIVVSPAVDWRTGFPYSILDSERYYVGTPNNARFPNYFSFDVTTFKTFDILKQEMDLGLQFFNITSHFNPRDVIPVLGSTHFGEYTNSFGTTLGGYMQVRWN